MTANFYERFVSLLIDGAILVLPTAVLLAVVGSAVPTELVLCQGDTAICEQPTSAGVAVLVGTGLVCFTAWLWYVAEFDGRRGATLGRRVMRCRLVRIGTDEPIGAGPAIGRVVMRYLSGLPCYLGYLWMLWDPKSQTWHDKVVDSQVVKARS